jgi:dTDP-glucose 4,6-dehydratase
MPKAPDQKPMEILMTGGCGFIGSNFVRYILKSREDVKVINIDNLTYAGNLANLMDVHSNYPERYLFIRGDIAEREVIREIFERFEIAWVINFAAESHVDRSVMGPEIFVRTNISLRRQETSGL